MWVVVLPVAGFEVAEHLLELVQDVVVDVVLVIFADQVLGLLVVGHQNRVSELLAHEELLDHRVHVTDAPQVLESHIAVLGLGVEGGGKVPGVGDRDVLAQGVESFL